MKKTLKMIGGCSLVLALGALSFLVVNENESAEAANSTRVEISYGSTCTCSWTGGSDFDFGTGASSESEQNKYLTGGVWLKMTKNAKSYCSIAAEDLVKAGSVKIAKNNLKIKSNTYSKLHGDLTGTLAANYIASSPVTVFTKTDATVGDATIKTPFELTIPAYTIPGVYTGTITVDCK